MLVLHLLQLENRRLSVEKASNYVEVFRVEPLRREAIRVHLLHHDHLCRVWVTRLVDLAGRPRPNSVDHSPLPLVAAISNVLVERKPAPRVSMVVDPLGASRKQRLVVVPL